MAASPLSRLAHTAPDRAALPAGADRPVADHAHRVDGEQLVTLPESDGLDAQMVSALYVDPRGVYANLPGVDLWDEERDARLYAGPWPVVAHPPCARWCQMAGLVEAVYGYKRGDDGGAFAAALAAVRRFGGVLEHPAHSAAWDAFNLPEPLCDGWNGDVWGGWSAYIEQDRYGGPARKPTWLYAVSVELADLRFGRRPAQPDDPGWWVRTDREHEHKTGAKRLRDARASATPVELRDVLLTMARSVAAVPAF